MKSSIEPIPPADRWWCHLSLQQVWFFFANSDISIENPTILLVLFLKLASVMSYFSQMLTTPFKQISAPKLVTSSVMAVPRIC